MDMSVKDLPWSANFLQFRSFMIVILTMAFLVSSMLALTAFLQAEAQWWKGPAAVVFLLLLGVLVVMIADYDGNLRSNDPVISVAGGAWICAIIIFVGSSFALLLRAVHTTGRPISATKG